MPNWCTNVLTIDRDAAMQHLLSKAPGGATENKAVDIMDFNKLIPRPKELEEVHSDSHNIRDVYWYLSEKGTKSVSEIFREQGNGDTKSGENKLTVMLRPIIRPIAETLYDEARSLENLPMSDEESDNSYKTGKKLVDNFEKYGAITWYEWSCDNWGTKWNAYELEVREADGGKLELTFSTAWNPPTGVLEELAKKADFELTVFYEEGGRDIFKGENQKFQQLERGHFFANVEAEVTLDKETLDVVSDKIRRNSPDLGQFVQQIGDVTDCGDGTYKLPVRVLLNNIEAYDAREAYYEAVEQAANLFCGHGAKSVDNLHGEVIVEVLQPSEYRPAETGKYCFQEGEYRIVCTLDGVFACPEPDMTDEAGVVTKPWERIHDALIQEYPNADKNPGTFSYEIDEENNAVRIHETVDGIYHNLSLELAKADAFNSVRWEHGCFLSDIEINIKDVDIKRDSKNGVPVNFWDKKAEKNEEPELA